jgi:hypothetical protein
VVGTDVTGGRLDLSYREARTVAGSSASAWSPSRARSLSASDNGWSAVLWDHIGRSFTRARDSYYASSLDRRRRQLCGRVDLRADRRPPHRSGAAFTSRREPRNSPSPAISTAYRSRKWTGWRVATPRAACSGRTSI